MQYIKKTIQVNNSKKLTFGLNNENINATKQTIIPDNTFYKDGEYQRVLFSDVLPITADTIEPVSICDEEINNTQNIYGSTFTNVETPRGNFNCIYPDKVAKYFVFFGKLGNKNRNELNITTTNSLDVNDVYNLNNQIPYYTIVSGGTYDLSGLFNYNMIVSNNRSLGTCSEIDYTVNLLIDKTNGNQENLLLFDYKSSENIGCIRDGEQNDINFNNILTVDIIFNYNEQLKLDQGDKLYLYMESNIALYSIENFDFETDSYGVAIVENNSNRRICTTGDNNSDTQPKLNAEIKIFYSNRSLMESYSTSLLNSGLTREDLRRNTESFKSSFLFFELVKNNKVVGYHFFKFNKDNAIFNIDKPIDLSVKFFLSRNELISDNVLLLKVYLFNGRTGVYSRFYSEDGYDGYYVIYDKEKNVIRFRDLKNVYNFYEIFNSDVGQPNNENSPSLARNNNDFQSSDGTLTIEQQPDC